ncbi:MAG: transposase [Rhodospirillum sp.]|nr:transposase [Rhodospirillum sp.]MCF8501260.1 transposase [Rhodospirillum sp.]
MTNKTRLILAGVANMLKAQLRLRAHQGMDPSKVAPYTIREKLLKIGARIITSVRWIKISTLHYRLYQGAWVETHAPCIAFKRHAGFTRQEARRPVSRFQPAMNHAHRGLVL